jgi:anaerobic dimethyl sulfoxide reductase subunit A
MVYVFNDRGRIYLPAKVTRRIIPGVLSVPQGAWYKPNAAGVDEGGSVNTLTKYHPSPLAKGNPQHTNLVEVEKA